MGKKQITDNSSDLLDYPKITVPVTQEEPLYLHVGIMRTSDKTLMVSDPALLLLLALARRSGLGTVKVKEDRKFKLLDGGWIEVLDSTTDEALKKMKRELEAQIKSMLEAKVDTVQQLPVFIEREGKKWRIAWEPERIYFSPRAFEGDFTLSRNGQRGLLSIKMRPLENELVKFEPNPYLINMPIPRRPSDALLAIPVSTLPFEPIVRELRNFRGQLLTIDGSGKKQGEKIAAIQKLCGDFTSGAKEQSMEAYFFTALETSLRAFPFSAVQDEIEDLWGLLWERYIALIDKFKPWALGKYDVNWQVRWERMDIAAEELDRLIETGGISKNETWTGQLRGTLEHVRLREETVPGVQKRELRNYLKDHGLSEFYLKREDDGKVRLHYRIDFIIRGDGECLVPFYIEQGQRELCLPLSSRNGKVLEAVVCTYASGEKAPEFILDGQKLSSGIRRFENVLTESLDLRDESMLRVLPHGQEAAGYVVQGAG